jgi:hypothetical protein
MSFQGGWGGNGQFSWPGAPQGAPSPPPPEGRPAHPPPKPPPYLPHSKGYEYPIHFWESCDPGYRKECKWIFFDCKCIWDVPNEPSAGDFFDDFLWWLLQNFDHLPGGLGEQLTEKTIEEICARVHFNGDPDEHDLWVCCNQYGEASPIAPEEAKKVNYFVCCATTGKRGGETYAGPHALLRWLKKRFKDRKVPKGPSPNTPSRRFLM